MAVSTRLWAFMTSQVCREVVKRSYGKLHRTSERLRVYMLQRSIQLALNVQIPSTFLGCEKQAWYIGNTIWKRFCADCETRFNSTPSLCLFATLQTPKEDSALDGAVLWLKGFMTIFVIYQVRIIYSRLTSRKTLHIHYS